MPEIEELKRLPCHCGGKAILRKRIDGNYDVFCKECMITTITYRTPEAAVQNWNFTMAERTAEVVEDYGLSCKKCGMWLKRGFNYCPECGRKLIWD